MSTDDPSADVPTWDDESRAGYADPRLALVEALDWLGPAFSRYVAAAATASAPTTYARFRVLRVLARRGPQRPSTLALELGITGASMTGLVDGLVDQGLVERGTDPDDGRVSELRLTALGEGVAADDTAVRNAAALLDGWSREDVLALLEYVKDLSGRLREHRRRSLRPAQPGTS